MTRCDSLGSVTVSQVVATIDVPGGGTARVPSTVMTRTGPGAYEATAATFGTPESPEWAARWNAAGAQVEDATLPPTASLGEDTTFATAGTDPGSRCAEGAFALLGGKLTGPRLQYFNQATFPGNKTSMTTAFRNGFAEWTQTQNLCGFPNRPRILVLDMGNANNYSHPVVRDNVSTVDFASLSSWPVPCPGSIACTKLWIVNGSIEESDQRFDPSFSWWDGTGSAPTGWFDFQSVEAHEFGHSIGFAHVDTPNYQVMDTVGHPVGPGGDTSKCCVKRTLGGGDHHGYSTLYPPLVLG